MSKYNFSKSSDWIPLFGRIVSAPIMAQKVSINYTEPFDIANLQIKIEKKLRQKVMKWRKHNVTIWNHYCSSILKEILPKLEMSFLMQENKKHSRHFEELHGLFNSYKVRRPRKILLLKGLTITMILLFQMRGFAINFPYTSIKQISNYIRATRIHTYENPSTELSLGVYVHPYPNYVLVVWLYFATLVRRR